MNVNDAKRLVSEAGTDPVNFEVRNYIENNIRSAAQSGSKSTVVQVCRNHNEQVVCEALQKDGFNVIVKRYRDSTGGLFTDMTEYRISW